MNAKVTVRMWYDRRNARLDANVAKLRRIIDHRQKLLRLRNPCWHSLWTLTPVILTALGIYLAALYPWVLGVLASLWALYYGTLGVLLLANSVHRRIHADLLRAGEYGHAIMWEIDPEWLALQSALQTKRGGQIIMVEFLDDPRIAADIATYLMASRHVRHRLQKAKRRPKPTHPDMVKLEDYANTAAERINRTLAAGA